MNLLWFQRLALVVGDLCSMLLAFVFAISFTQVYHADLSHNPLVSFFTFGVSKFLGLLVICAFWYREHYIKRRPFWEELRQILWLVAFFVMLNLGMAFVLGKGSLKILIIGFWLAFAVMTPLIRVLIKLILRKFNLWQRPLYIVGTGKTALNAYNLFARNNLMGYTLVGFIDILAEAECAPRVKALPARTLSEVQFLELLKSNSDCDIIIALEHQDLNRKINLINFLQHNCLSLLVVPEISGLALYGAEIDHFFGNDQLVLRLNNNLARSTNALVKRIFDLICVTIGLIVLAPFFLVLALLIKFSAKSQIFYLHQRIGKHGKPFYCIKFQSMYANSAELLRELLANDPLAKQEWEQAFKLKDDPRVTPIGRWLRKTSLDELPQLFNVLLGNMSLVGPRPIVQQEIERYKDGFYYYQLVLPGISGLWQVSGRSETDYSDRVRLDAWYVKNWSLWYDVVILVKTIGVVFKRTGAY